MLTIEGWGGRLNFLGEHPPFGGCCSLNIQFVTRRISLLAAGEIEIFSILDRLSYGIYIYLERGGKNCNTRFNEIEKESKRNCSHVILTT